MDQTNHQEPPVPANLDATLAKGVAHDVNQLLGIILARTQVLLASTGDSDWRRQLALIETATQDAATIVRRLLLPVAESVRVSEPVALIRIVEDCLELTRSRWEAEAASRGCRYDIITEVPPDLQVAAPAPLLREVLTNLVINALEAMPDGGRLTLRGEIDRRQVRLVVRDSGQGFSLQALASLRQARGARATPGGRGIGLATCWQLVGMLGGELTVASEAGRGATFTVALPAVSARVGSDQDTPRSSPPPDRCGRQRILVVDNEVQVRALLAEVLGTAGHEVTLAVDGREALGRFRPDEFDILLVDLTMPGLSGLQLAQAVRARDRAVGIVLITGWGGESAGAEADPGVIDLVATKPLDLRKIEELIDRAAHAVASRRGEAGAAHS